MQIRMQSGTQHSPNAAESGSAFSALEAVGYPYNALALLESMQGDSAWGPALIQRYSHALSRLHEVEGWQVTLDLALRKWRPGPDEILIRAAKMFSPYPDSDLAYGEVREKMLREGHYDGEPKWSHPNIKTAVFMMGGWLALCTDENLLLAAFKAQFRDAYANAAEAWRESVIQQLALAPAVRDARWFTAYNPYRHIEDVLASVGRKGQTRLLHPLRAQGQITPQAAPLVPPPPSIADKINRIGLMLPAGMQGEKAPDAETPPALELRTTQTLETVETVETREDRAGCAAEKSA